MTCCVLAMLQMICQCLKSRIGRLPLEDLLNRFPMRQMSAHLTCMVQRSSHLLMLFLENNKSADPELKLPIPEDQRDTYTRSATTIFTHRGDNEDDSVNIVSILQLFNSLSNGFRLAFDLHGIDAGMAFSKAIMVIRRNRD